MSTSALQLHARACDLLEAAHGIAAAGTAADTEAAIPAALACIEESLALLAVGVTAMGGTEAMRGAGLDELGRALRDARSACERAGRPVH